MLQSFDLLRERRRHLNCPAPMGLFPRRCLASRLAFVFDYLFLRRGQSVLPKRTPQFCAAPMVLALTAPRRPRGLSGPTVESFEV